MRLTEQQIQARAQFRQYLGDTYGADTAALIMNIADLESNFRADATNKTSSAAGLTQITSGHWATLSEAIRQKISRGEMAASQLPSGMTPENITDFNKHKFDEISSAFMTRENIDFIGKQYVRRANKQRALTGKPAVNNMRELTGGNAALEAFMIAGGHKDGWGVHQSGKLEGTGFGAAIRDGEINLDALYSSYAENRTRNERAGETITDGMGHGLTYALFASDNVMETAGGPKLQLRPDQIKTGLALKQPNVSVANRLAAPWIDRAQQLDPGFEPNDETLDQWLPRLDLADNTAVAGANDIVSTSVAPELSNPEIPRANPSAAVAAPESRSVSEDPSIAARAASRLSGKLARGAEDAFGAGLSLLAPEVQAAETPVPSEEEGGARAAGETVRNAASSLASGARSVGQRINELTNAPLDALQTVGSNVADFAGSAIDGLGDTIDQQRLEAIQNERAILESRQPSTFNEFLSGLTGSEVGSPDARLAELAASEQALLASQIPGNSVVSEQPDLPLPAADIQTGFGVDLDAISNFGTNIEPYQQYAQTRAFSDYQQGLENVINDFNTDRRLGSAELEAEALQQAAINQAQDEQDLALSLAPTVNLNSTPIQPLSQPSLANFATPADPNRNIGNILPSNGQLQNVVDQSRLTPEDYQLAAAAQLARADGVGSVNDIINRARGTNLEEQADNLRLGAIQQQLDGVQSGVINSDNFPEFQALLNRTNNFTRSLSDQLVLNSRGN